MDNEYLWQNRPVFVTKEISTTDLCKSWITNICDTRDLYSWQKRRTYTQKRPQRQTCANQGSQIFVFVGLVAHNQSCHTQMRHGSRDFDMKYVSPICVWYDWLPHTNETHFMKDFGMKYKSWDHMTSTWNMCDEWLERASSGTCLMYVWHDLWQKKLYL